MHAPPFEYDPVTSRPPDELVEVGPAGTVVSWSWLPEPLAGQPLTEPFGWALIRLDGADTAMLHAVDAGSAAAMRTGMRVRPRWAASGWAASATSPASSRATRRRRAAGAGRARRPAAPVTMTITPVRLRYEHTASAAESAYLRGLADGRLIGQRCPACGKVYVPSRGACPADGVPTDEEVELPDTGTVTTFSIVNVGYPGQQVTPPYVAAAVLLDGADIAFQHLILGCEPGEVHLGMRVRAGGARGGRLGEHQPLRADRGAGRRLRDLCEVHLTEVAVVGFAQSPAGSGRTRPPAGWRCWCRSSPTCSGATGLTKADIGFWCSGSSDYLAGRAFSFVQAVDAIGAVPPIMESHVEMDGAWALYEAWVKIVSGEAEIALAYGFGKSSGAELRRVLALQLDPYLVAPLWPDSVSVAALQARLGLEAGRWTEKDMAEVAARSRAAAVSNPPAQVSGDVSVEELLDGPTSPTRCGRTTARRSATGPRS